MEDFKIRAFNLLISNKKMVSMNNTIYSQETIGQAIRNFAWSTLAVDM
jgi:hypothetical protein